jgi:LEA14-like dessication related protein
MIGVGAYYLLTELFYKAGYAVADNFEYDFESAKVRYSLSDLQNIYIDLGLKITNNNPAGGRAESFVGSIYYSSAKITDIIINEPFEIGANDTRSMQVTAKVDIAEFPVQILQLVQEGELLGSVRIKGMLNWKGVNIPIDQNVPLI